MLESFGSLLFTILSFLIVLNVVIFVHEYGHFQVARWFGVAVRSFSFGWGKEVFGWNDKKGTRWKVSQLPIGGFVSFIDDVDATSARPVDMAHDPEALAEARKQGFIHAQPAGVRALVSFAGPAANFIFAIVVFAALVMIFGKNETNTRQLPARVDGVEASSPAARAGVKVHDVVVGVNGARIATFGELQDAVANKIGKPLKLTLKRNGALVDVTATPMAAGETIAEGPDTGVERKFGRLGIATITQPNEVKIRHPGPIEALGDGVSQTWGRIASTGYYLANVVTGRAAATQLAGPLGIAQISGQTAHNAVRKGSLIERVASLCANLIFLAAVISVAVGIVNLLPLPILDGGQILYCAIEAVRRRPMERGVQEVAFFTGAAAVGLLFAFATWNDLQRLNVLEFLRGMLS